MDFPALDSPTARVVLSGRGAPAVTDRATRPPSRVPRSPSGTELPARASPHGVVALALDPGTPPRFARAFSAGSLASLALAFRFLGTFDTRHRHVQLLRARRHQGPRGAPRERVGARARRRSRPRSPRASPRGGLRAPATTTATPTAGIGACHAGAFLSAEEKAHLEKIAAAIGTPGKGITACDEGPGTIGMRFEAVGVENTEENRRAYRQVLFESPGASDYLSAAILDPRRSTSAAPPTTSCSPRF